MISILLYFLGVWSVIGWITFLRFYRIKASNPMYKEILVTPVFIQILMIIYTVNFCYACKKKILNKYYGWKGKTGKYKL